jgi:mono/diheme cytochrome c family protein
MRKNYQITMLCTALIVQALLLLVGCGPASDESYDKLMFHNNKQRTGWNAKEDKLTPESVSGPEFGQLWQTAKFGAVDGDDPLLFASPLYVDKLTISDGTYKGKTFSVIFAATDVGYLYAVNAAQVDDVAPGTILWSHRLNEKRSRWGNIGTPIIDLKQQRIYMVSNDPGAHKVHALALGSGAELEHWPVTIDTVAIDAPGMNKNGASKFPAERNLIQRSALNLNNDGSRLYVAFAGTGNGWMVSINTVTASVASAFSSTAITDEKNGGMWASSGPSVDKDDYVHMATGAQNSVAIREIGVAAIFPDSEHNWGQSIIRLKDDKEKGFELVGTYSPFNYAQSQAMDIDLASSGTVVIDLDPSTTSTPHLLVAGGKQGNVYLLDRDHMPGSLVKRPPVSEDSETDASLLSPDVQPQFGKRGPLSVFGPYEDRNAMNNQARSRSTPAYFKSENGKNYLFVTGSAKTGDNVDVSTPPSLARLEIVTSPGKPAYLRIDQLEETIPFQNPGCPVVTSDGEKDGIVWIMDTNVVRTAPLRGANANRPVLYAFDALTLKLLWKSAPDELGTSGKYNEPTVVKGVVYVGTDRIQAFGLQASRPAFAAIAPAAGRAPQRVMDPAILQAGQKIFTERCIVCHGTGKPGIPTVATLSKLDTRTIFGALMGGVMKAQAAGLTETDARSIAAYLISLSPAPTGPGQRGGRGGE